MRFARVSEETSGDLEYRWTETDIAVCAIAVPDQVTRDLRPAASLSELVGNPFGRWVRGDPKP
jgi:hypothetical protein